MDLSTILGWSITTLIIAGLIVFLRIKKLKKKKQVLSVLQAFAKENNSEISTYDTWDKTLIGIDDKEESKLFFIRSIPENEIRQVIVLSDVLDCKIAKTSRNMNFKGETAHVIDKIELVLSFSNKKPNIFLEFYNTDYDHLTLAGELQLADKWLELIKKSIAKKQKKTTKHNNVQLDL